MPQTAENIAKADKGAVVEVTGVVGNLDEYRVRERLTEMCERMGKKPTECECGHEQQGHEDEPLTTMVQRGLKAKTSTA